nr:sialidase family protein [uncultured Flavobacterium sp.]
MERFTFYFLLFISFSFLLSSCDDTNNQEIVTDPIVYSKLDFDEASKASFLYNSATNPALNPIKGFQGMPSIVFKDGVLIACCYAGQYGEEPNNYIIISSSNDMGNTWIENQLMIAPLEDRVRHFDQSLWLDKYKNVHLSWTMTTGMWDGGVGGVYDILLNLKGNDFTITRPQRLFGGVMPVKPLSLGFNDELLLFPVYGPAYGGTWFQGQFYALTLPEIRGPLVYTSNYNPVTKKITTPKLLSRVPTIFPSTFDEHTLVNIGKDSLLCLLRKNKDGLCTNISIDNGKTWQTEKKFTQIDDILGSSKPYIGKLKSGNLLLVVNNSSTERKNMTAYLSKDKGKTWPYKLLIDERKTVSYPSVALNNNEIYLVYDYNRGPDGHIIFTKFTENDIIEGVNKPKLVIISKVK